MTDPVVKTIVVACDAAMAFDVFVHKIAAWWPMDSHASSISDGKAALDVTIEPHLGGAVFETRHDGKRNDWGEVQAYEPGQRFATTWHPGSTADHPTRVEVVFEDLPDGRAKVTLTHSGWEIWGEKSGEVRKGYDEGWEIVFAERYLRGCA